jgi:Domain of unknown function (DUF1963)
MSRTRIPPFKLELIPLDDEARANPPGFPYARPPTGQRHRIGGDPDFLQHVEWPRCPQCGEEMSFYAQIDSLNRQFAIADVGMIFVFLCFDDFTASALVQST